MMETGDGRTKVFTKFNLLKFWTVCVMFFINLLNYMDRYTIAGKEERHRVFLFISLLHLMVTFQKINNTGFVID